jgi:hypothetical protein
MSTTAAKFILKTIMGVLWMRLTQMGVFDFLRPATPAPTQGGDDGKTIRTAPKPGTLYYLRARNIKSGFDDILVFDSELMRRRYIGTARESTPTPGDWYFSEYETTAESRLQQELENQRKALEASYKKDIAKLEYKIRGLQSDKRNLQNSLSGGSYLQKYNNELHANSIIKRELAEERQKNVELLALIEAARQRKEQEQVAQIEQQAQQQEQEQGQIITCKENARLILKALNPAQISEMLEVLEDDSDFMTLEGPGQVRLIKYYANKIVKM